MTDLRKAGSYQSLSAHRMRSVVFSLAAGEEALYAGLDFGELRVLDFSEACNPPCHEGSRGGFNAQQKAALAQALAHAEGRQQPREGARTLRERARRHDAPA